MPKQGRIPPRTCIGCRNVLPKRDLLRFTRNKNGKIEADLQGDGEGRGAYICYRLKCLETALKHRRFQKALGGDLPSEVRVKVTQIIDHKKVDGV